MTKKIILLVIVLVFPSLAQIISTNSNGFFPEIPQAEIKDFSLGSYGFGPDGNRYNPGNFKRTSGFYLSVGMVSSVAGGITFLNASKIDDHLKVYENSSLFRPNFLAFYRHQNVVVQLSFANDYLFYYKTKPGLTPTPNYDFHTNIGVFRVTSDRQEIQTLMRTLQVATSIHSFNNFTLTLGILSPSIKRIFDIKVIDPVVYKSDFLKEFQYFVSLNYRSKRGIKAYLQFLSQDSHVPLSDGIYKLDTITLVDTGNTAFYYGRIAYGVQTGGPSSFKLSLEMRHQFLTNELSDIFNSEAILGAIYQREKFALGILYTRYLKYETLTPLPQSAFDFSEITTPYSVGLSIGFKTQNLAIKALYQYSKSRYKLDKATNLWSENVSQFISVNLGYYLDL
ncbi:MAG: hypothetical protein D6748_10805 [Calditrichaeota bacterium]|nr:MAG: hypothetical protein D6748_10805 [Calditrichota bacterium]